MHVLGSLGCCKLSLTSGACSQAPILDSNALGPPRPWCNCLEALPSSIRMPRALFPLARSFGSLLSAFEKYFAAFETLPVISVMLSYRPSPCVVCLFCCLSTLGLVCGLPSYRDIEGSGILSWVHGIHFCEQLPHSLRAGDSGSPAALEAFYLVSAERIGR